MLSPLQMPNDTLFLYRGDFGRAILSEIDLSNGISVLVEDSVYTSHIPYASFIVSAWSGEFFEDRERIDSVAFLRKIPHLGITLKPNRITCGPLVRPGETACFSCYLRRRKQHNAKELDISNRSDFLAEGFSPADISISIGLLRDALQELNLPVDGVGGTVREFDLTSGSVSRHVTVSTDRCERCSYRFSENRSNGLDFSGLF